MSAAGLRVAIVGSTGYASDEALEQRLAELEGTALEDNVTRWILEQGKVIDTPVAFDELMGHRQA